MTDLAQQAFHRLEHLQNKKKLVINGGTIELLGKEDLSLCCMNIYKASRHQAHIIHMRYPLAQPRQKLFSYADFIHSNSPQEQNVG